MRKLSKVVLGIIAAMFLMSGVALAADKFAYVDLSRTFGEYGKTKEYDKVLGDKENVYTADRKKKVEDFKQFQTKFSLLSDKEKESRKEEFENKVKGLQEFDRQKQTDLRKEQDEKMKEILKDIEEAVKVIAVQEGYTMVFNDRVLVYQTKTMDITDKVVAALNKNYKK
jgi:Skp family chaperone for outer membrane proteins